MQKCIRSLVLELNTVLELVHKFRTQSLFTGGGGGGGPENFRENPRVFGGGGGGGGEDLRIFGKITWFLGEVKGIIRRQQGIKGGL